MYGQPDLSLGVEHAAQVTPGHGEVWLSFNCFQVTSLEQVNSKKTGGRGGREGRGCKRKNKPKDQIKRKKKQKGQTEKELVSILTKSKK